MIIHLYSLILVCSSFYQYWLRISFISFHTANHIDHTNQFFLFLLSMITNLCCVRLFHLTNAFQNLFISLGLENSNEIFASPFSSIFAWLFSKNFIVVRFFSNPFSLSTTVWHQHMQNKKNKKTFQNSFHLKWNAWWMMTFFLTNQ